MDNGRASRRTVSRSVELCLRHDGAGGRYEVIVGGHKVFGTVHSTGGWTHYETHSPGILRIDRVGKVPIFIRPAGTHGKGLMNLCVLRLVPDKK